MDAESGWTTYLNNISNAKPLFSCTSKHSSSTTSDNCAQSPFSYNNQTLNHEDNYVISVSDLNPANPKKIKLTDEANYSDVESDNCSDSCSSSSASCSVYGSALHLKSKIQITRTSSNTKASRRRGKRRVPRFMDTVHVLSSNHDGGDAEANVEDTASSSNPISLEENHRHCRHHHQHQDNHINISDDNIDDFSTQFKTLEDLIPKFNEIVGRESDDEGRLNVIINYIQSLELKVELLSSIWHRMQENNPRM